MGKKLAIKGDIYHGHNVIALLEMLGGNNKRFVLKGFDVNTYYYIDRDGDIINCYTDDLKRDTFICLTLNEFYEKYPFKVGDTIKFPNQMAEEIVKMRWDEDLEDIICTSASGWTRHLRIHLENPKNNKTKMSKKLAIRGHSTRGKEVIELLEMLGGNNRWDASGGLPNLYYFISNECILYSSQIEKDVVIFTIEEFLKKYPYKIGDKAVYEDDNDIVVISEIMWDDTVGDIFYNVKRIDEDDCFLCPPEVLKPYKEEVNMKDKEDKLFDSIIWHLRNSVNNGKQNISGGECEKYFRELVDKVKETNMNETKFGTAKEPLEIKSNVVKLVDGKVVDNLDKRKTMNKKLAIRGHATRGNEIIEILKMLGGKNNRDSSADTLGLCYLIDDEFDICAHYFGYDDYEDGELNIFTLEKFLEKFPFKVGDFVRIPEYESEVRILKMKWCPLSEYIEYLVYPNDEEEWFTADELLEDNDNPRQYLDNTYDNTKPTKETITPTPDITAEVIDKNNCDIQCPDGYEFYDENGNLIGTKVMMRPKKPKYPKTYKECLDYLGPLYQQGNHSVIGGYYGDTLEKLQKLLICRIAYWKIAGEQMGLDKPWEHNYLKDANAIRYAIYNTGDEIVKLDGKLYRNYILYFPTEGMRDTFYENFKNEIEQCKELL